MIRLRKKVQAFTLIELMVTMVVLAISLTFAISSFSSMLARQRLEASANHLRDFLTVARTEAIGRSKPVYFSIQSGNSWCFAIDSSNACACGTANDCQMDGIEKKVDGNKYSQITLSTVDSALQQFAYDGRRGLPTDTAGAAAASGAVKFSNTQGDSLTVRLNIVGRISMCSETGLRGYGTCPP